MALSRGISLGLILGCMASTGARAEGIVNPQVEGNELRATVEVSAALNADLTIRFENVVGLSAESLGLSASVVDPLNSSLMQRLGTSASIPRGFPVLLRVEPPAAGGLSFSGTVTVELYTHHLQYEANTPLRLFSAEPGDEFRDVTSFTGSGSYRTGARKGTFSEFLIVADNRALDAIITVKFDRLGELLRNYEDEIDASLRADLSGIADAARAAYSSGANVAAIQYVEAFATSIEENSGQGVPDVWQSSRELTNVAGELRAAADTLRFSLTLASNAS